MTRLEPPFVWGRSLVLLLVVDSEELMITQVT